MPQRASKGMLTFHGANPLEFIEGTVQASSELTEQQEEMLAQVGTTVKAYVKSAEQLLKGKYAHLTDWAPIHLAEPGNVLYACCADGVVLRYERKVDNRRILTGWFPETLSEVTSLLSQEVVQCHSDRSYASSVSETGALLELFKEGGATKERTTIASFRVGFDIVIDRPDHLPEPPSKPLCVLSVRNEFEIALVMESVPEDTSGQESRRHLIRTLFPLSVGWECIEVFPFVDLEQWKPEYSKIWAESDLLAAVVARQMREKHYESLDPNAEARRQLAEVLRGFRELLDSNPDREEVLQSFLRAHPALLCPAHTKVWPKLALGDKVTDFVFQEAAGEYLLVELEKSTHRLFRKDGHPTSALNVACGQIIDWKRYLEDNLATVQRELGLVGISASPRSLVVIGRSGSLRPQDRRKIRAIDSQTPRLTIMTYDDVHDNAKAVIENLLGPLWVVGGNTQVYHLGKA